MTQIVDLEDIKHYLSEKGIHFSSLEPLSGGGSNYVWRFKDTSTEQTRIVKHAEPFTKFDKTFAIPAERMNFEAHALKTIDYFLVNEDTNLELRGPQVHPPKIYNYDAEAHVLIMSEGGAQHLKDAYTKLETDVLLSSSRALGRWLAKLHSRTSGPANASFRAEFDNDIAKNAYRYSYNGLAKTMRDRKKDAAVIRLCEIINARYGELLNIDDECICHGDFWTANVLIDAATKDLTVVDWEIVRRGCGATDVGQFVAEAWLLERFKGSKGFTSEFIRSYAESSGRVTSNDDRWTTRAVVQFGTHLAFWPTVVPWGSEEDTDALVDYGLSVLQKVVDGDLIWLKENTPFGGFISDRKE